MLTETLSTYLFVLGHYDTWICLYDTQYTVMPNYQSYNSDADHLCQSELDKR